MAYEASGVINGTTSNEHIDVRVEWSSQGNEITNDSVVTATLKYKRTNTGFTTFGTGTFSLTIDGNKVSVTRTITIEEDEWVTAISHSVTVTHNNSGTKSVRISASGSIPDTTLTSSTVSKTVSLAIIKRASAITSASNVTLGNACSVKWTPHAANLHYKLKFALGEWSYTTGAISPNQTTEYTYTGYTIPLVVANQLPTAKTGTMTVTLYTYLYSSATTQVGSESSKTFTVTIPDNSDTRPVATMTLEPVNYNLGDTFSGLYIQGKSRIKATFSGTARYNAHIDSYGYTVLGKGYADPFQSELITESGVVTAYGRVKDSRGLVTEVSKDVTFIPYSKPKPIAGSGSNTIVCSRCDESGTLDESGTYLKINAGRSYSKVMSGSTQKNFCLLRYRYKAEGATTYSPYTTLLAKATTDTDYIDVILGNVVSSTTTSYLVEISVIDDIGEHSAITFTIPTDKVAFHLKDGGDGAAFGKYAEKSKVLEIASDWSMDYKGGAIEQKFYSLRGHQKIPSGADLNDYKIPNVYAIETDTAAENITHMPYPRSGLIKVYAPTGQDNTTEGTWRYIMQEYRSVLAEVPTYYRLIKSDASCTWTYGDWSIAKGSDTGWVSITKSGKATASTTKTRNGEGCFYRVVNGNHVYVSFNCGFEYSGATFNINSATIPEAYRPKNNVYVLCPVDNRAIARVSVATDGYIYIGYVQDMASGSATSSYTAGWIDGYIDYWL